MKLDKLLKKISPLPWRFVGDTRKKMAAVESSDAKGGIVSGSLISQQSTSQRVWNEVYITHACTNLPALLEASKKMMAHYDDLCKSNPGFMGKMCLQDYALWNEALLSMERAIPAVENI